MSEDFIVKLHAIFDAESAEQLVTLDQISTRLKDNILAAQSCDEEIGEIFRIIHTLKASTGAFGYQNATDFLHHLETGLQRIRNGEQKFTKDCMEHLLCMLDIVNADINHIIVNHKDVEDRELLGNIDNCGDQSAKKAAPVPNENTIVMVSEKAPVQTEVRHNTDDDQKTEQGDYYFQIVIRPYPGLLRNGLDPVIFFKDLSSQGDVIEVRCQTDSVPSLESLTVDELYLSWELVLKTKVNKRVVEDVFIFAAGNSEISIENVTGKYSDDGKAKLLVDKKVGEILVERGVVTSDAIQEVLEKQIPVGELLVKEGKVAAPDLAKALKDQEAARSKIPTTVRVDITKLDFLVNLVGELLIAQSRLKTVSKEVKEKELQRGMLSRCDELLRLISELQRTVMNTRMVPVDTLFSQFHRTVRDLSVSQKKEVRLALVGVETELDKNIIEKISNPMKHLVRNSVDHGVETPEERIKAGKPREALVTLKAYQQEGGIFIEVSDDGKGLNKEVLLRKAKEKGLVADTDELTDDEIYNLIFLPGFSTAKEVTDISGRGVGMDVVKRAVEELKGKIKIVTELGKGTSFVIQLPLTLAIIEGLLFKVGEDVFAIPLLAVEETVRPKAGQVNTIEGRGEYIDIRGRPMTLIRLHRLMNIPKAKNTPTEAMVLIVIAAGRHYAIMVDEVVNQQQIVLKSLEQNYGKVKGLSGATILGDGSVASIIDPGEIVELFRTI